MAFVSPVLQVKFLGLFAGYREPLIHKVRLSFPFEQDFFAGIAYELERDYAHANDWLEMIFRVGDRR